MMSSRVPSPPSEAPGSLHAAEVRRKAAAGADGLCCGVYRWRWWLMWVCKCEMAGRATGGPGPSLYGELPHSVKLQASDGSLRLHTGVNAGSKVLGGVMVSRRSGGAARRECWGVWAP